MQPVRPSFRRTIPSLGSHDAKRARRSGTRLQTAGHWATRLGASQAALAGLGSLLSLGSLAVLAALFVSCAASECASDHVFVDGQCVPQCEPNSCGEGLFCVRSVCRPECTRSADCLAGDSCERIASDDGRRGRYCYGPAITPSPYRDDDEVRDAGPLSSQDCEISADCTQDPSHHCVSASCEVACYLHEHCGRAGACTGAGVNAENQSVSYCEGDTFPRADGQYGSQCLDPETCDEDNGFRCITGGEGDTASYCTRLGCEQDSECPSGYYCSANRVPNPPCSALCGLPGSPGAQDCIPDSQVGPGQPHQCAPEGGLRLHVCLQRTFCSPCETDADCRGQPGQLCARGPDGEKTCTVRCSPEAGSCPWGASTTCEVFDPELGLATCGHRFGACRGDGSSCTPCVDDGDCPRGFCTGSSFSGERFCFDEEDECACEPGATTCSGGGCPLTPGGLEMNCVSRSTGEAPSVCFGGFIADESARFGCWL